MRIREMLEGEFATKREKKLHELKERKARLKEKYPRFREAEDRIFEIFSRFNEGSNEEFNEALRIRDEVVKELNIEDELKERYDCEKCSDRGFIDDRMCSCFKRELAKRYFEASDLLGSIGDQTFLNYDASIFPDDPIDGGMSQRKSALDIRDRLFRYCKNFNPCTSSNLLFYGPTGTGKTYMTGCVCNYLIDEGYLVIYTTAISLMELYQEFNFYKGEDRSEIRERLNLLKTSDFLIIDDLGTEMDSSLTQASLFDIINHRSSTKRPFLINTNLSFNELSNRYDDRIFSRILAGSKPVEFIGKDIRWEVR